MPPGPRLELTWPHKDEFLLVPKDDGGRPVWVPRDHPAAHEVRLTSPVDAVGAVDEANPYADDTVFVGDSLDALRVMCEVPEYAARYRGKVKLVYIDPPFNTGQTFTHYDDWMEHSVWLSFMRERLLLISELLAPDGSVWVHLDDAEAHRMRCLLDEIFGAQNFVADITWQKKYKPGNSLGVHATTNPVLVYGREAGWRRSRGVPPSERQCSAYKNPDDDPRGAWRLTHAGVRVYLDELLARGAMPTTFWPYDETGHGEEATRESKRLTDGVAFSTPKPERLLERVLTIASDPGDLVVDCFAGSGTTAAVAHKMGRRWATVELSATTVADFVVPRLTKVVEGADPGGITEATGWTGGGGFRVVKVEPSLYEVGPGGLVLLRDDIDEADLARAMCGQLGYTHTPGHPVFAGRQGRNRLAVLGGVAGAEEVDELLGHLADGERITVAAAGFTPGTADHLAAASRGSQALKIPRDVLTRTLRPAGGAE